MAEPRTAKRTVFTASTIDGLRDELNRWVEEISERFETETIVVKGLQFIPVRGPYKKDEATLGLMFMRELEYNQTVVGQIMTVQTNSSLTKALVNHGKGTMAVDADGEVVAGGLHD